MRLQGYIIAALLGFFGHLPLPSTWRRPVVERIFRQLVFSGVEAAPLLMLMGAGFGLLAAEYGQLWMTYTRRSDLLYTVVNTGIVREIAPLMSVLLALAASGAPMCSEMAMMKVTGEITVLRCQGVSAYAWLIFPRMLGLGLACGAGAVVLAASAFAVCSLRLMATHGGAPLHEVLHRFLFQLQWRDVLWMQVKSGAGGLVIAAVACTVGLSAGGARTEVPRMVARGMAMTLGWVTVLWILLTVLIFIL